MKNQLPAFPVGLETAQRYSPGHPDPLQPHEILAIASGMTLRDWFAGQALAGDMSTYTEADASAFAEKIAARCYAVADAMLAQRIPE